MDEAERRAHAAVGKVEKIAEDVGVLAGAISLKETAKYYEDEADAQKKNADWLRILTVVVALGAVAMGVWRSFRALMTPIASPRSSQCQRYSAALRHTRPRSLASIVGGRRRLGAFNSNSRHLAHLQPRLIRKLQQLERVRMTRRTFGAIDTAQGEEDDTGPGALSLVNRVLRREPEPEES